jgi:hypothetical protein
MSEIGPRPVTREEVEVLEGRLRDVEAALVGVVEALAEEQEPDDGISILEAQHQAFVARIKSAKRREQS